MSAARETPPRLRSFLVLPVVLFVIVQCFNTSHRSETERKSAETPPALEPLESPIAYDPKIAVAPEAVTIAQAQAWLKRESVVIIDIRTASSYKTSHIPGAVSIPLGDDIHDGLDVLLRRYKKQTPILLYCDSDACPRSMDAALALINERRYADVRYLEGGFAAWEDAGKPPLMDKK